MIYKCCSIDITFNLMTENILNAYCISISAPYYVWNFVTFLYSKSQIFMHQKGRRIQSIFFLLHMSHLRNEKICTFCHTQQVITYTKKHVLRSYACTSFLISVAAWLTYFDFFGKTCFCNYEQFVEFIWNDLTI